MTSRVLVEWAYIQVCGAFINKTTPLNAATLDLLSHIGEQLIHILMSCRHKVRGAHSFLVYINSCLRNVKKFVVSTL